ncbi:MAG: hypothetical protein NZM13_02265 [Cyclobacteriaceae bacterium]|nr:hypothetical protein [Cyclobacteriaceae bacterium]MDW8332357.1 hypothetical protein [Cyclobacteriaceae bacterium]
MTSFPDSLLTAWTKTRDARAITVAENFRQAWSRLNLEHQLAIQNQVFRMKRKGYRMQPHLVTYLAALAEAVLTEGIAEARLGEYLQMTEKVIDELKTDKAQQVFQQSLTFFRHHALTYDKSFRLYARDDDYRFEYIEFIPPPPDTTTASTDDWNTWPDDPVDTLPQNIQPYWMTPPPPPLIEGPAIRFQRVTFNWVTPSDSVFLNNTKGDYSLTDRIFSGEEGTFNWSSAFLPAEEVFCNFTAYSFSSRKPELQSDLVKFNYTGRTPGIIYGKFEFRSQPRKDSVASSWPRFISYENTIPITGFGNERMKFKGGFSLTGNRISSKNVNNDYSTLEVTDSLGVLKFRARSRDFVFTDSTVTASGTAISIYQGNDSISHRSVRMYYNWKKNQLVLTAEKGPMRYSPYTASFFGLEFSADRIRWNLNADSLNIDITGGRSSVPMVLESFDYYDPEDFHQLKGVGFSFHPLAVVARYCLSFNTRTLHSGDLANFTGLDIRDLQRALQFLASKGLVEYWPEKDLVNVKEKAINQYRAYLGEADYDNMKIHSVIDSYALADLKKPDYPNATVNFKNRNMVVRGVEEFNLSDSLNVVIRPDSSIITILQNRDIKFNGTITAGNFEITGKDFTLKYDSFFINLKKIDSINFYSYERNARGQMVRRKINNAMVGADSVAAAEGGLGNISKSSGTLYISRPDNKSGKMRIPNYPRLDATTGGVIYFDRPEVLNGVYDRSIFFVVPPFKLDSLNDADPAALNFEGTFVTSGMFPSFKEKLHTMPDKSLGFEHVVPKGGYQLYKGDAKLDGVIRLDNRGIRSAGTITYLAATVRSPDFVFYPDSVTARGPRARIAEKQFGAVHFPQASLPDFQMKWYPKRDQMRLRNLTVPFNLYDSTAQLNGMLIVSKNGVAGAGKLETRGAEVLSREMNFSARDFNARHARFRAKSADPNKPLIDGTDVRVRFNLAQNYADISPEIEGVAAINFPYAQFKTSIPNARWDLTTQKITMTKSPDVPLENSYFYTTRKDLDSLHFNAERAEYDLKTQQLKVSGIPYIVVADAKITPENNEVLILENARIGTLKNTTIIIDTLNGYHRLTDGVVDIVSRKEFHGHATYQYVNFLKDTFAIKMTDFRLEPVTQAASPKRSGRRQSSATLQTVATGSVSEKDKLVLGAGMFYKGEMTMYATRPALQLTGAVKLDIKNIKNYNTWIRYEQSGEETEVLIDFDNAITEDGRKVNAGLHLSALDNSLYISFLNEKNDQDEDFFVPSGTLYYDVTTREYKIEDREKAAGNKLSGKVFAYNDETQMVRFEGPVNLFYGNKDFNITATAIGQGNMKTNDIQFNALLLVNTTALPAAFQLMATDLMNVVKKESVEEGLGDRTDLLYKLADIVGERVARDYEKRSTQAYVPLATLPETAKAMTFANVNFKWSAKHKAFYSEGTLGLSNIGRNDINGAFEGFMEVRKNEDGSPVFNVFFKASPESWYFFSYEDNRLLMYSSNEQFNTTVAKKTNSGKAKVGELVYVPATEDETLAFVNRFRRDYYGIEVPYNLSAGTAKKKSKKQDEGDGF